ncbi:ABC transporter ATP-binding protein [Lachnoanaerobaculum sp. Marseille-Q4761]|uniref:ABC transporter ATP-binding protein n=1 Tax=Lachnoanaerobaculum sp. Marseille-Q4761 TaxID=2819511 RepID=UPI001AA14A3A|nr:ABC transporter ATP-binding protein [Lachnoanaerobaculum sp. Marseille-Q4761]MBO1870029.1 ABC transporter ATP-binding protein [Lachnoanaerobaculum sp. Marseille-Q4761]
MEDNRKDKVKVTHLTKKFDDLLVLDDISFTVKEGEFLCIVGPTGCGKTTFLNSLTKLYKPTSGEILINDEPVDLLKHNIAYIFQEYSTMPWLTVEENVGFGLDIKNIPKSEAKEKVNEYLQVVGLEKYRNYYPDQLSASMLQRVVIARAFATEPEVLLMDEPYGQLDIELRFRLEDELLKLWERNKTTVIFITHNIEEAVYLGERILVLTNKPTCIKKEIYNNIQRPRNIAAKDFVDLRNEVTDLIKWW